MFEETHFRGRRLAIRSSKNMTQPNFDLVYAQKNGFEDKACSMRFQLPKNTKCLLYKNKNFKKKLPFELEGTGKIIEIPMLSDEARKEISSIKFVP